MARSNPATITLKHFGDQHRVEYIAGAAIGPGELLELDASNEDEVILHNSAGEVVMPRLIALETQTPDSDTDLTIDQDYDSGDTVYCAVAQPGEEYYMYLADGETASLYSVLQSDGAGALEVQDTLDATLIANSVVGIAMEALDNGDGGAPARIKVQIV